ncbi:hypothetical protein APHAL10511_001980 [Amanita phalloides]|nr:hypothetical protein APHAL10511_001980 [Amanita phalloides]
MAPTVVVNKIDLSRINSAQEHSSHRLQNKANTFPRSVALPSAQGPEQKKVNRRSNKPIINWLQRKLAGTVKKPDSTSYGRQKVRASSRSARLASLPLPAQTSNSAKTHTRAESSSAVTRRKTVSLNGDEDLTDTPHDEEDDVSGRPSSMTRDSTWSPASVLEADDDASVRPLPPSVPPSPSPSRSSSSYLSSSYLSNPHTFKSMAASTKPTTLLSIDLASNGMAHIAQAPPAHVGRLSSQPHARQSSLTSGSITFSALSAAGVSRPSSTITNGNSSLSPSQNAYTHLLTVQAPLHTAHHPRNNPRPSSPPLDNASVLTLASSAFGIPGRQGFTGYSSTAASALGGGDSISQFDGSMTYPDVENTSIVIGDDDRLDERDFDASVRALRPRSSRRGSWESEASGWSARIHQSPGTPSLAREKSLWTANSVKTGGFSADNDIDHEGGSDAGKDDVTSIDGTQAEIAMIPSELSLHPSESEPASASVNDASEPAPRADSIDTVAQAERLEDDSEATTNMANHAATPGSS